MAESLFTIPRLAAWGAIALAVAGCLVVGSSAQYRSVVKNNEWRRTADGWEWVGTWPAPAIKIATKPRQPTPVVRHAQLRLDTHPAALALLQLVGVLLSLVAFRSQSSHGQDSIDWKSVLARSFRASVFGS